MEDARTIRQDGELIARRLRLLPGSAPGPLDPDFLDFLCAQTKESAEWDFKETMDTSRDGDFAKIAKDIFAFSNNGGGYLLIGWKDRPFKPVGLDARYHVDQAELQDKFNSYSNAKIELGYVEFTRQVDGVTKKFAAIYIPPSPKLLVPIKDGLLQGKQAPHFKAGEVFIRRGTQSVRADDHEKVGIEKRIREDDYQISLITGRPDRVRETIESNLFPVLSLPKSVYVARLNTNTPPRDVAIRFAFVADAGYAYSLQNPLEGELRPFILHHTVRSVPLTVWLDQPQASLHFTWLLNDTIKVHCRRKGMFTQDKHSRAYFPTNEREQPRYAMWRGMKRRSERRVAWKMYASQFGREIYVHDAVGLRFVTFGDAYFLQLTPSFVLTQDGRKAVKDPAVGSVVTRLSHRKYNASCYRDLHFWAEQLETKPGAIEIGGLCISATPLTSETTLGIRGDYVENVEDIEADDDAESVLNEGLTEPEVMSE